MASAADQACNPLQACFPARSLRLAIAVSANSPVASSRKLDGSGITAVPVIVPFAVAEVLGSKESPASSARLLKAVPPVKELGKPAVRAQRS